MHPYIERVQDALVRDAHLKDLLRSPPGTPSDIGAGIATAMVYTGLGSINGSSDAVFVAANPEPKGSRRAALHLGERIEKPTLLDVIRYAPGVVSRRPDCGITPAIGLLGWMAANDPSLAYERTKRFGDTTSIEAGTLVEQLKDQRIFSGLHLTLDDASYRGTELSHRDFRTDARNRYDDEAHQNALKREAHEAHVREAWKQRKQRERARGAQRPRIAYQGD